MSNSDDVDGYTTYVCTGIYIEFFAGEREVGNFVVSKKKRQTNDILGVI